MTLHNFRVCIPILSHIKLVFYLQLYIYRRDLKNECLKLLSLQQSVFHVEGCKTIGSSKKSHGLNTGLKVLDMSIFQIVQFLNRISIVFWGDKFIIITHCGISNFRQTSLELVVKLCKNNLRSCIVGLKDLKQCFQYLVFLPETFCLFLGTMP